MFQKFELSEIAIEDLDESKLDSTVINLENISKGELSSIILTYLSYYIDHDLYDEDLFWELKQGFAGWKIHYFDQAGILKKDFKRVLMKRGIFVPLKGYSDSIGREIAISGDEPHTWTKEEITVVLKRKVNYYPEISILENKKNPVSILKTETSSSQSRAQEAVKSESGNPS
ncbi:hypothetical protein Golomagni_00462 [Golovinomyces magnicellulatus]|nr:hypothetical protein Golomagni_00462 [Golovinomyces magnicellulatus]